MKLRNLVAASALGVVAWGVQAAPLVIDLFDSPADPLYQYVDDRGNGLGSYSSSPGNSHFNEYGPAPDILGGYRDLLVDASAGAGGALYSRLAVQNGSLSFSNDNGVRGKAVIQWDGPDNSASINPTGLGGIDLTSKNQFEAIVEAADQGFDYEIIVYTDGTQWSKLSSYTLFPVTTDYVADYMFSWFLLPSGSYFISGLPFTITRGSGGPVDFSNVGAIELILSNVGGNASLDLSLKQVTAVPEPASLALAGIGLIGLAALRRRRLPV